MVKLNLQEKRRIEDLIFSEIDEAIRQHRHRRNAEEDVLEEKLIKNPPAVVARLREDISKLQKQIKADQERIKSAEKQIRDDDEELRKVGYRFDGEDLRLASYGDRPEEMQEFDRKTNEIIQQMEKLKKRSVLMVYSDSDEVKGLFDKVSAELQKIVR
jgi:hypothetical protein